MKRKVKPKILFKCPVETAYAKDDDKWCEVSYLKRFGLSLSTKHIPIVTHGVKKLFLILERLSLTG